MTDEIKAPAFVHLRAHSEYSIIDGLLRIKSFVKNVAQLGMPAVALTDATNLFGLVKFYQTALEAGVKPIIGADLILREEDENFHFTALCQNNQGYHHLTELISHAYLHGQVQGQPTVQWEWLQKFSENLIILSGAKQGDVGKALLADQQDLANDRVQRWQRLFPNRYYIELQRTQRQQDEPYLQAALEIADRLQVAVVATNDVRFLNQEDFEAHEARVCIHSGYVLEDHRRPKMYSEQQYLKNTLEMQQLFADIPEALQNTVEIAKRCNLQLSLGSPSLPNFPTPENMTLAQLLQKEAEKGLQACLQRLGYIRENDINSYRQRLQTELDVIVQMGFPGYFLIVADFIRWAKQQKIPVGPGRGSGAGSLVAFALGITELDPLKHDLLFERFLNPERISMPDFDIDFCMEGRDRVIEYVSQHYGRDAVSQIITFGTMAAKAVVRDVGRVLGFPYGFVDKVAKLIPFELGITLEKALQQEEQLSLRYQQEVEVANLIDLAKKLEGLTRNAGKHAGGVVISPTKITDFAPLYCEADGSHPVTQFDKDDIEAVGLVKFDFLGLRTLTIIDWALQTVNKKRHQNSEPPIDINNIPLDDPKTFALLKSCATTAVFQLESRGMKDLIRRLQPDSFEEITALVALFRPGPLQSGMVDDFINRKHGRDIVHYPHPLLEPILRGTYGVILYQEQVMQIAQVLAGYTLGGADILRRAMGKKKPKEMAKQRQVFTAGAVKQGIDNKLAESIFDLIEKFAGYGFNKSHSAAYALISYQTAWLKVHYPAEFMAAVLSSDMDNTDKVVGFIEECKRMGIKVLAPNVNTGQYAFTVNEQNEIVYGLGAIKGAGFAAIQHLVDERENNENYSDLFNFCQRLDLHKVSRRVIEPLIRSGAMDVFHIDRARMFASIDKAIKYAEQTHRNNAIGQTDLFSGFDDGQSEVAEKVDYVEISIWDEKTKLTGEKETLGFYVSGHPLYAIESELNKFATTKINQLTKHIGKMVSIGGMLLSYRAITTRTGRRMAVLNFEDTTGRIEITLFSKLFEEVRERLENDEVYVIKGKIEEDDFNGGIRMRAESIEHIDQVREQLAKRIVIDVKNQQQVDIILSELPQLILPHCGGSVPISIKYRSTKASAELVLGDNWRVKLNNDLVKKLQQICGKQDVIVEY